MVSDAALKYAMEEHYCPHCNTRLSCCNTPPIHVGDGLGWGTDVFFICLNDECSMFIDGWKFIEEQYGKTASYRYMLLPGEKKGSPMMVASKIAFTDAAIDLEELKKGNERYQKEQKAIQELETCVADKNPQPALCLIIDEEANLKERQRAVKLMEEINDLSCLDAIRNHKFRHTEIGQVADLALSRMLKNSFQKECPYCAEIIKAQAKICKYCGKEMD